ncbi:MAG: hypothetical protein AB8F94_08190 [Saprospiraceae bacterium]
MLNRKISLVELYGHSEVLFVLYKLLKDNYDVSIFTTHAIFLDAKDYFESDLKGWHIQRTEESTEQFLKRNSSSINENDLLIFTTLISSFRFFSNIKFKPTTIFIIHNANAFLAPKKHLWLDKSSFQNFTFDIIRFLRNEIQRDQYYKWKKKKKMNYISFSSNQLSKYAKTITNDFDAKIIKPFPFTFYENYLKEEQKGKEIIISIPGSVTPNLRDYEIILNALKEVIPVTKKKIILQLLGSSHRAYGQKLVKEIKGLENENFQLVYFERLLSQKEFDQYLKQTDFIILPIKRYKRFGIVREEYGQSSISGGLNDIIRFGIPTLLIDSYLIEKPFAPLISTFKNKIELVEKMTNWIENSTHVEIRKKTLPALEKMNEENTRIGLVKQIENLLR